MMRLISLLLRDLLCSGLSGNSSSVTGDMIQGARLSLHELSKIGSGTQRRPWWETRNATYELTLPFNTLTNRQWGVQVVAMIMQLRSCAVLAVLWEGVTNKPTSNWISYGLNPMNILSAYLTYALYERQSRVFHHFCVLRSDGVVTDVDGQYPGHKLEILTAIGSKGSGNVRRQLDKERRDRGKIRKL